MFIDVNTFFGVVFIGAYFMIYIRALARPKARFLVDIDWRDQLSVADITDLSADYWGLEINEYKVQEQRQFCAQKMYDAIKQATTMKQAADDKALAQTQAQEQPRAATTVPSESCIPQNVVKLY